MDHVAIFSIRVEEQKILLRGACEHCAYRAEISAPPIEGSAFLQRLLASHVREAHPERASEKTERAVLAWIKKP